MEGILIEVNIQNKTGIVDTRNDLYNRLTVYFRKLPKKIELNHTIEFELRKSKYGNYYGKFIGYVERNDNYLKINTEDRMKWYEHGAKIETFFVEKIAPELALDIRINPQKSSCKWAIDLYDYSNNCYADLKNQTTPFFTAAKYKYKGIPCAPAYSVTFNKKDYEYYLEYYPNADIYFLIHWMQLCYKEIKVPEVYGIWRAHFRDLAVTIQNHNAPLHQYKHRKNDDHNAKESYIFNLKDTDVFEQLL